MQFSHAFPLALAKRYFLKKYQIKKKHPKKT